MNASMKEQLDGEILKAITGLKLESNPMRIEDGYFKREQRENMAEDGRFDQWREYCELFEQVVNHPANMDENASDEAQEELQELNERLNDMDLSMNLTETERRILMNQYQEQQLNSQTSDKEAQPYDGTDVSAEIKEDKQKDQMKFIDYRRLANATFEGKFKFQLYIDSFIVKNSTGKVLFKVLLPKELLDHNKAQPKGSDQIKKIMGLTNIEAVAYEKQDVEAEPIKV